jgi:hypothetical protein
LLDAAISSRSIFDHTANQVTVATNNDKTDYALSAGSLSDIDTELSTTHGVGSWESDSGTGMIVFPYTVSDGTNGVPGVLVVVTTDIAGLIEITRAYTNNFGIATFHLDAGTYYFWSYKTGYRTTNPDTEVVV